MNTLFWSVQRGTAGQATQMATQEKLCHRTGVESSLGSEAQMRSQHSHNTTHTHKHAHTHTHAHAHPHMHLQTACKESANSVTNLE